MATQNVYEGLFIFDSNKYAKDPVAVSNRLTTLVQQFGGEMLASRLWEERRLAYPINGQRKGTYWLTYYRLDTSKTVELERQFALDDNIMRSLSLKVDPKIVDTLVQHALTGSTPVHEHAADVAAANAAAAPVAAG
ncbi:MAG: 30S ribosomal protein S6 [Pirellulales bacterium]